LKNRGFDVLCVELRTIQGHKNGFVIEKIVIEPSRVGFQKVPYCVTVNFLTTGTLEHERMTFYADFSKQNRTANIQDYQILSFQ
jgi:hypothetical protein